MMFVQSYLPHINKYSLCVQHCASFWGPRWIRLICCHHGSQRQVRCNSLLFRANQPCLAHHYQTSSDLIQSYISLFPNLPSLPNSSHFIHSPHAFIAASILSLILLPYLEFHICPLLSEVCIYQQNQFTPQRSMRSYLMTIVYTYMLFSLLSYCIFNTPYLFPIVLCLLRLLDWIIDSSTVEPWFIQCF